MNHVNLANNYLASAILVWPWQLAPEAFRRDRLPGEWLALIPNGMNLPDSLTDFRGQVLYSTLSTGQTVAVGIPYTR